MLLFFMTNAKAFKVKQFLINSFLITLSKTIEKYENFIPNLPEVPENLEKLEIQINKNIDLIKLQIVELQNNNISESKPCDIIEIFSLFHIETWQDDRKSSAVKTGKFFILPFKSFYYAPETIENTKEGSILIYREKPLVYKFEDEKYNVLHRYSRDYIRYAGLKKEKFQKGGKSMIEDRGQTFYNNNPIEKVNVVWIF